MKRFYTYLLLILMPSCMVDVEIPSTDNISIDNFIINANYHDASILYGYSGIATASSMRIEYSKHKDFIDSEIKDVSVSSEGYFKTTLNGLQANTTYYMRCELSNSINYHLVDNTISFKTKEYHLPIVEIDSIYGIDAISAKVSVSIIDVGCDTLIESGICLSANHTNPDIGDQLYLCDKGSKIINLENKLEKGKQYFVRAYAKNHVGVSYGEVKTFNTPGNMLPKIETISVDIISSSRSSCACRIVYDGGTSLINCGVCYSTHASPTIEDNTVSSSVLVGEYTCLISGLTSGQLYYVRAFATNSLGTAYGKEIDFIAGGGLDNGYVWLDMGTAGKWATVNVGASQPHEYGNFYGWCETSVKYQSSSWSTQHYDGNYSLSVDPARVNMGGAWRMPSKEEWNKLISHCSWTWSSQNGINGYIVTASNGNKLFLPAGGEYDYSEKYKKRGVCGYYWSSSVDNIKDDSRASGLEISQSSYTFFASFYRYQGFSVRAIQ